MNQKENPTGQGGESLESRLASTLEESTDNAAKASEKSSRFPLREPRHGTQLRTILELLRSRPGQWVGVNEFMRQAHCAAAHSAVSTLRQRYGFPIENRMRRAEGGVLHSEYQLKEETE